MRKELSAELSESVKQWGAKMRGEKRSSRAFRFDRPDVRSIRNRCGLSQLKFAEVVGISVSTFRNWEQDRLKPEDAARVLLLVASVYLVTLRFGDELSS